MLGVCEESVPPLAPETQKRQGKFTSDCEKMFFKTSSHNITSATVFAASPSIYSRLASVAQDPTRTTHLVVNSGVATGRPGTDFPSMNFFPSLISRGRPYILGELDDGAAMPLQ
jgi:hypothetical protein